MSHYQGILLWTEVVCARCHTTTCGAYVRHGRRQMRMVMSELDKQGWTNVGGDAICIDCLTRDDKPSITLPTPIKGQ
jgi:hypothetical protein